MIQSRNNSFIIQFLLFDVYRNIKYHCVRLGILFDAFFRHAVEQKIIRLVKSVWYHFEGCKPKQKEKILLNLKSK